MTGTPTLTTLVSFNDANGAFPDGDLIADANGDLFGTLERRRRRERRGTVFEIVKTAGGLRQHARLRWSASTAPTVFPGRQPDRRRQRRPVRHDLQRRRERRTARCSRSRRPPSGYASTPDHTGQLQRHRRCFPARQPDRRRQRRPVRHDDRPRPHGDTTDGTVFEIVKTAGGYASTPTTLVSFNGTNGERPEGGLIADSNGDLFGTTFEAARTTMARCSRSSRPPTGYASTPTTLVSFNGTERRVSGQAA